MLVPSSQFTGRGNAVQPVTSRGPSAASSSREEEEDPGKRAKGEGRESDAEFEAIVERAQLDAGKEALRQLLKERKTKRKGRTSWLSLLKLYATIVAGLMIIGGLFTLLFLVPMTIDPALATLSYAFHPKPVLCMTTFAQVVVGLRNISWCSCTEGCTSDVYNCSQITVVYRNCSGGAEGCSEGSNATYVDNGYWDNLNASLYINVKGCGYPPVVNCSNFFRYYGVPGRRFLCYYSKVDRSLVMPQYDPKEAEMELFTSLGWTLGAQVVGVLIILLLHCPLRKACPRKCCRRKQQQQQ